MEQEGNGVVTRCSWLGLGLERSQKAWYRSGRVGNQKIMGGNSKIVKIGQNTVKS